MGRLTLNPLKHLDPLGTIAFFIFSFGWAKPVPVDARYFHDPRKGMLLTAIAGPCTNFILAACFALVMHVCTAIPFSEGTVTEQIIVPVYLIAQAAVFVNLILGVFNMLPIPPLDGSNVLAYFLPPELAYKFMSLERYGFVLLIGIILIGRFSGYSLFGEIIFPAVTGLAGLLGVNL